MSEDQVTEPEIKIRKKKEDMDERVTIILERGPHIPKVGLNVGHNGTNYLIKPGVPVSIPRKVLNVIKDARGAVPVVNPDDQTIMSYEERAIYPFSYV